MKKAWIIIAILAIVAIIDIAVRYSSNQPSSELQPPTEFSKNKNADQTKPRPKGRITRQEFMKTQGKKQVVQAKPKWCKSAMQNLLSKKGSEINRKDLEFISRLATKKARDSAWVYISNYLGCRALENDDIRYCRPVSGVHFSETFHDCTINFRSWRFLDLYLYRKVDLAAFETAIKEYNVDTQTWMKTVYQAVHEDRSSVCGSLPFEERSSCTILVDTINGRNIEDKVVMNDTVKIIRELFQTQNLNIISDIRKLDGGTYLADILSMIMLKQSHCENILIRGFENSLCEPPPLQINLPPHLQDPSQIPTKKNQKNDGIDDYVADPDDFKNQDNGTQENLNNSDQAQPMDLPSGPYPSVPPSPSSPSENGSPE